jgi:hypothetical protein
MDERVVDGREWRDAVVPYLAPGCMEEAAAEAVLKQFVAQ